MKQAQIISVQSLSSQAGTGLGISLNVIIGSSIGGFFCVLLCSSAGYFVFRKVRQQAKYHAFLSAFRNAKAGQKASSNFIPLKLQKHYVAEKVLGKGAFGCVVQARTLKGSQPVALKLLVPEQGSFGERELRQLMREANVLELFTASKCEHAVHLAGVEAVSIKDDLAWFIMELLEGCDMETHVYDPARGPISDVECIKAARNILSALKVCSPDPAVLHQRGFICLKRRYQTFFRACARTSPDFNGDCVFPLSLLIYRRVLIR